MPGNTPTFGDNYGQVGLLKQRLNELGWDAGSGNQFDDQLQTAYNQWRAYTGQGESSSLDDYAWNMMSAGYGAIGASAGAAVAGAVDYRQKARESFGALAAWLDHPEVGPILLKAAQEGWTGEKLQAAILQTTFWKTTSASQRVWDQLKLTDPAEAAKQAAAMAGTITGLLSKEGVPLPPERVNALAEMILRNGMSPDQIPGAVLAEVQLNPNAQGGLLGSRMTQVRQASREYGMPMSEQLAFDWAKQIASGTQTIEGLEEYLRDQATAAYGSDPRLAKGLADGFSVRQMMDPQIAATAGLLGIDPDTIDFRDAKWAPILQFNDGTQTRTRTLDETMKYVRSTNDYWRTTNAETEAAQFVQRLASQFGKA